MIAVQNPVELIEHLVKKRVVFACGVFDGVHLGHQKIFAETVRVAKEMDAHPVVFTFAPHPRLIIKNSEFHLITLQEQRLRLFNKYGMDAALFLPFTLDLAALEPLEFLDKYFKVDNLDIVAVCVGSNWKFGAKGKGNVALLEQVSSDYGLKVVPVKEYEIASEPVSSTRIRNAVSGGDLELAANLLGRPYTIMGKVIHGKGIGGKVFHCPTANVHDERLLLPPDGVYAARASINDEGDEEHIGIVYVGTAPTVNQENKNIPRIVELHLFSFSDNLYDKSLEVEFVKKLRDDKRFNNVQELKNQIDCDIENAKQLLSR